MKLFILFTLFLLLGTLFFFHLLQQSKKPTGLVGNIMMTIWNKSYLPMVQWAIHLLPKQEPKNILDIGVGNGLSTKILANSFPNTQVYGIDLSSEAIKSCYKISENNNKTIQFSCQSIENTTFLNQQFQLITAFQTHFHWENLTQCFDEIYRIMSVNGTLLLSCEHLKLNFFLKDLSKPEAFKAFLRTRGFELQAVYQEGVWISYIISKKNLNA